MNCLCLMLLAIVFLVKAVERAHCIVGYLDQQRIVGQLCAQVGCLVGPFCVEVACSSRPCLGFYPYIINKNPPPPTSKTCRTLSCPWPRHGCVVTGPQAPPCRLPTALGPLEEGQRGWENAERTFHWPPPVCMPGRSLHARGCVINKDSQESFVFVNIRLRHDWCLPASE